MTDLIIRLLNNGGYMTDLIIRLLNSVLFWGFIGGGVVSIAVMCWLLTFATLVQP
jgi:hypothetical protein